MPSHEFEAVASAGLDPRLISLLLEEHQRDRAPRLDFLWRYFRNPLEPAHGSAAPAGGTTTPGTVAGNYIDHAAPGKAYRLAQEAGLPARLTGDPSTGYPGLDDRIKPRREVVIENDIAWRVQTMVDFMFGRPVSIISTDDDPSVRRAVDDALATVWHASGGVALMQDIALLGHVYGWIDLALRLDEQALLTKGRRALRTDPGEASPVQIEPIEPARGVPVISPDDYRRLDAYAICTDREVNETAPAPERPASRTARLLGRRRSEATDRVARRRAELLEIFVPGKRLVYEDRRLLRSERSALLPTALPIVHIQNLAQPFRYEGLGEVEPLIPLQDELNTRLSDRASRVTMQSFRMYLAKGIEGFEEVPVAPGRVWSTDNPDASIESFGGDVYSPSESQHIDQIREALDKASAVPPVAGGVVRARIGNLSSATALRVTLLSLLGKTARKRITYGRGLIEVSRLALAALDRAGVLRTTANQRGLEVVWPEPEAVSPIEEARAAQARIDLGVDRERALAELGYADTPGAVGDDFQDETRDDSAERSNA